MFCNCYIFLGFDETDNLVAKTPQIIRCVSMVLFRFDRRTSEHSNNLRFVRGTNLDTILIEVQATRISLCETTL
jgi:hypothetical protein